MASAGLQALAAILGGGFTGATEGLESTNKLAAADADRRLREQQLAQQQRQFEEQTNTPLDLLPADLRAQLGPGPKVRTNLINPMLDFRQAQQKQTEEKARRESAAAALEAPQPLPGHMEGPETAVDPRQARIAPFVRSGILGGEALGKILFPDEEKMTVIPQNAIGVTRGGSVIENRPPEGILGGEGETVDLERGVKTIRGRDSNGRVTERVLPLSQGDRLSAHTERMVALQRKLDSGQAFSDLERQQYTDSWRTVNTLQPSQLQPGGYNVSRGPMPMPSEVRRDLPTGQVAPPGAYRGITPPTTEGEAEKVGMRNSIIKELEGAARTGDTLPQLQDWKGRGSLRVRSYVQGHTPFETLTPEEQTWVTTHDRLRIFFEQATMGLGPFRSPEMQKQLAEIIGRYWTPGTATRLRALATILRTQAEETYASQEEGGRRPLSVPPRTAPAPGVGAGPQGAPTDYERDPATGRLRRKP